MIAPRRPLPYTATQRREASDWFVVIHAEDDPGPDTLQAWISWMDQHEGNRLAFEDVAQAWHAAPGGHVVPLPTAAELQADSYDGEVPVGEWLSSRPRSLSEAWRTSPRHVSSARRTRRSIGLVAAALVMASIGMLSMYHTKSPIMPVADEFVTKAGEQIQITLADGSHVWLGPKSKVAVQFTTGERRIQLLTGEAFFTVKKDKSRPFVVRSAGGEITAVGTAFNVRDVDGRILVTVTEGVVTVAPENQSPATQRSLARVASGQQASYDATAPSTSIVVAQSPVLGERARWRDGILVYRDEPLTSVIEDVGRYSDRKIEAQDAALAELRYSGVVYTSALNEWMKALPESFPVTIVDAGDRTLIRAR